MTSVPTTDPEAGGAGAPAATEAFDRVEEVLATTHGLRDGAVVGVTAGGVSRVWQRGPLPDGAGSIFEIGSVTKTFTALLLADLAREGVVVLEDPVAAYLPVAPPVVGRPITLEDLATHHSGLPRLPAGMTGPALTGRGGALDRRDPYAHLDEAAMTEALRLTTPTGPPGERFSYSNFGAGLLGWALARRLSTTYDALVAQRLTGPLGLHDTWIDPPAEARRRVATGHGWWGREAHPWHLAGLAGAGGLRSTAADLLRFLAVFAEGAAGPLAAAAAATTRARHEVGRLEAGLGWLRMPAGRAPKRLGLSETVLFHDGGTGGFRSFAGLAPATGAAAVVLSARARGISGTGFRVLAAATGG
ncbi:serine hydrolase domain-containing protein [Nocardioides ochotonae]|uniref:serine hydrolase domain-containing protein n=1 Tax=Nocardioides ochotonae TaxID=2685869 RepID=UPI00140C77D3|nr:serine hydrolase domain-containing protein [Nocardioides ochotonae]